MKNPTILKDSTLDNLIGNVKKVIIWSYSLQDGEILKDNSLREYRHDGVRKKSVSFNLDGSLKMEQLSEFDISGNKVGYINYNKYGDFDSEGKYDIDQNGRIIAKYFNDNLDETIKFSSSGKIIQHRYVNSGDLTEYMYDDDNKYIIKENYYQRGALTHIKKYANDINGNVLKLETYRFPSNELIYTQIFNYNSLLDVIESYVLLDDGSKQNWYKYSYEYDDNNNWISKITSNSKLINIQKNIREIEYFEEKYNLKIKLNNENFNFFISNFEKVYDFIDLIKTLEYKLEVYSFDNNFEISGFDEHKAIWIGSNVPINDVKLIIKQSKKFYPHLEYIKIFYDDFESADVFIGGSTSSAVGLFNCLPLSDEEFDTLQNFIDINDLHSFINNFCK